jgi:hypothetical protein
MAQTVTESLGHHRDIRQLQARRSPQHSVVRHQILRQEDTGGDDPYSQVRSYYDFRKVFLESFTESCARD